MNDRTVIVVDDDSELRNSICQLLRAGDFKVESFASGSEFLSSPFDRESGCLVLDVRMPDMTGLQVQKALHAKKISLPIVFLTGYGEIAAATEALRAGAVDFLTKPFSPQLLIERVNEALEIDRKRREKEAEEKRAISLMNELTARQREILPYLVRGETTKAIALQFGISTKTVHNHKTSIFEKMNVDNAAQLAYMLRGIIE